MSKENKSGSKKKFNKIIAVCTLIIAAIVGIPEYLNWNENRRMNQHEMELEKAELQPSFDVEKIKTISLGTDIYQEYRVHNVKSNINGGTADMHVVIIVKSRETVVKIVGVEGALYEGDEIPFQIEEQTMTFFLNESDNINLKKEKFEQDIKEFLENNGEGKQYEFNIEIAVITDFRFSNQNNDSGNEKYIIFLDDLSCYINDGKYDWCDRYSMIYDREDQGEEYDKLVSNTGYRIMDCG